MWIPSQPLLDGCARLDSLPHMPDSTCKAEVYNLHEAALDRALKECLLKLQFSDAPLEALPKGCRFEIVAYSSNPDAAGNLWVQEPSSGAALRHHTRHALLHRRFQPPFAFLIECVRLFRFDGAQGSSSKSQISSRSNRLTSRRTHWRCKCTSRRLSTFAHD